MSIADLIRKRGMVKPANANPAKVANDGQTNAQPLARLATLALATPRMELDSGLAGNEETLIRAWLTYINEPDAEVIDDVLSRCRQNQETRAYFLKCADIPEVTAILAEQAAPAAREAAEERAAIMVYKGGVSRDEAANPFEAFYGHIMGPGKKKNCCFAPNDRYCAVGRQLRDAYYHARRNFRD